MTRKADKCCTDKIVTIKTGEKHSRTAAQIMSCTFCKVIPAVYWTTDQRFLQFAGDGRYVAYSPSPPLVTTGSSKLILNNTFRI
jgi:hypothetical protein